MKKLYLNLQLAVVTQDEAEIDHMMEHTIKDTIINSLNRKYITDSFFELLGYNIDIKNPYTIGKSDTKDKKEVQYIEEYGKEATEIFKKNANNTIEERLKEYNYNPIIRLWCYKCNNIFNVRLKDKDKGNIINEKEILCKSCIESNKIIEELDDKGYFSSGHLTDPEDNLLINAKCSQCNKTFDRKGNYSYIESMYCDNCIHDKKT